MVGIMYFNGQGVPQDYAEAVKWYRKAADQGYAEAQTNLGFMYANGHGVPQDYAEAAKWYCKAADQGNVSDQYNLGYMYSKGEGVPQDYAEAAKWYRKAADQGNADAQYNLGLMYEGLILDIGEGVPPDISEAAKWYRKAADQGNADAQYNLGYKYYIGGGVLQDYVLAHMWFNLAASVLSESAVSLQDWDKRDQAIGKRDLVASKMTPAQIAEAEQMTREWKPKKEK
jgi:hypothetical protein